MIWLILCSAFGFRRFLPRINMRRATEIASRALILAVAVCCAPAGNAAVRVEKAEDKGWKNCYRITNGEIEANVTADVAPVTMRFAVTGDQDWVKGCRD